MQMLGFVISSECHIRVRLWWRVWYTAMITVTQLPSHDILGNTVGPEGVVAWFVNWDEMGWLSFCTACERSYDVCVWRGGKALHTCKCVHATYIFICVRGREGIPLFGFIAVCVLHPLFDCCARGNSRTKMNIVFVLLCVCVCLFGDAQSWSLNNKQPSEPVHLHHVWHQLHGGHQLVSEV